MPAPASSFARLAFARNASEKSTFGADEASRAIAVKIRTRGATFASSFARRGLHDIFNAPTSL